MGMSTFRRSLKAETKKMGKGGKGAWRERWRLPQNNPTPILFIEASYVDPSPAPEQVEVDPQTGRPKEVRHAFFKARKHKRKSTKNGKEWYSDEWCSAGHDPHAPQPCIGCYHMDKGDKSLSVSDIFAFGVIHLAPYHGHPVLDDKGGIMMSKSQQGGPVINYTECIGRSCNFCRTLAGAPLIPDPDWPNWHAQQITSTFGQRRYLEIGKGHLSNLESWDGSISSTCAACTSQITTDGFKCPYCNTRCIDMATDPRTDEQIQEAVAQPYPCMRCNRPVILAEEVSCEACESQGRVGGPYPFFGTVLHALREGENMKSQMVLRRFEGLPSFERTTMNQQLYPNGPTIGQILQGKTIAQLVDELNKPYDFPEIMKPRDLKEQAKRLDLELPQSTSGYQPSGSSGNGGAYLPYGQTAGGQQNPNQGGQQGYQSSGNQGQAQYGGAAANVQGWTTGPGHTGNSGAQQQQQNWQNGQQGQGQWPNQQDPNQQQQQNWQQPAQQQPQQGFQPQQQQGFVQPQQGQQGFVQPQQAGFQPQQGQQGFQPGPQAFVPQGRQNFSN